MFGGWLDGWTDGQYIPYRPDIVLGSEDKVENKGPSNKTPAQSPVFSGQLL